jgi:hypothetical protein
MNSWGNLRVRFIFGIKGTGAINSHQPIVPETHPLGLFGPSKLSPAATYPMKSLRGAEDRNALMLSQ